MKRTVTALYETREQAEKARQALVAAHLCTSEDVEIRNQDDDGAKSHHRGLGGWLSDLFGGHDDHQLYAEGLRRGHVLLTAKVDDLNETRAGVIMEAAAVNLAAVERTWRDEGWNAETAGTHQHHPIPLETAQSETDRGPYAETTGSSVRAYTL